MVEQFFSQHKRLLACQEELCFVQLVNQVDDSSVRPLLALRGLLNAETYFHPSLFIYSHCAPAAGITFHFNWLILLSAVLVLLACDFPIRIARKIILIPIITSFFLPLTHSSNAYGLRVCWPLSLICSFFVRVPLNCTVHREMADRFLQQSTLKISTRPENCQVTLYSPPHERISLGYVWAYCDCI